MLADANKHWHKALDNHYFEFLQTLTELKLDLANAHWQNYKLCLKSHIEFEENFIEPLDLDWPENTLKFIQSDHLILNRITPKIDSALNKIQIASAPRAALVEALDIFIKMRNVLQHHDIREIEQLYPLIERQLDKDKCHSLAEKMNRARKQLGDK